MTTRKRAKKKKHIRPLWDDYFINLADEISKRSTCNRGRSGCVLVKDKQILATGYVGAPTGFPHCDDENHEIKEVHHSDGNITKHCVRTIHAEQSAICQAAKRGIQIEGATIYARMTPCKTCAMLIVNCGLEKVYCERRYHAGKESEKVFKKAGIKIVYKFNEVQKYKDQ